MRVAVLLLVCLLMPFTAQATVLVETLTGLTVVDSVGTVLGTYRGDIVFRVQGRIFSIGIAPEGFRNSAFLSYEAKDCAGPALIQPMPGFLPSVALAAPGTTVYLPGSGTPQPKTVQSFIDWPDACQNYADLEAGGFPVPPPTIAVVPAVAVVDLAPLFIPPFSLRADPAAVADAQVFDDVPPSHPFYKFVQGMASAGLTGGCSASPPMFCPDAPFTRGQAAVWFGRSLRFNVP